VLLPLAPTTQPIDNASNGSSTYSLILNSAEQFEIADMRIQTLGLYLIGNRQAILEIGADHRNLGVGLIFVLSAGLAREYDGQDLLREPWHLLIPLGASLAASFLLFLIAFGRLFFRKRRPPFFTSYLTFLTLFWMTAPLAWLYALPDERFLSPGDAVRANFWTLALVAAWRVALMVRVVSVISRRGLVSSLFLVMAFADAAALLAVYLAPRPVVSFMAGVRLSDSEQAVLGTTLLVAFVSILWAPIWLIGGAIAFFAGKPAWQVSETPLKPISAEPGIWILAALSLAFWLPILPWTQAEQQLRTQVEQDLKAGRIAEALDVMSAHAPYDFPPQWDPPPRIGYYDTSPHILDVMAVVLDRHPADWVRDLYVDKLRHYVGQDYVFITHGRDIAPLLRILERLPEGPDIVADQRQTAENILRSGSLPEDERENLKALIKLADRRKPSK
jgi:hypothetical protein